MTTLILNISLTFAASSLTKETKVQIAENTLNCLLESIQDIAPGQQAEKIKVDLKENTENL